MTGEEALRLIFHPRVVRHLKKVAAENSAKAERKAAPKPVKTAKSATKRKAR